MTGVIMTEEGETPAELAFCEQVAACIDQGNIDQTIVNRFPVLYVSQPADEITPTMPVAEQELIDQCDPDHMYGMVIQLVALIHRVNVDFYEYLIASGNFAEALEYCIRAIPIIGELPFDEMIGFVNNLLEDVGENYLASYTEEVRHQYECDIFCMAKPTCTLNLGDLAEYFFAQFLEDLYTIDWLDFVELILQGTWSGTECVHLTHALFCWILSAGFAFVGIDPPLFTHLAKAYFNDPNPDWTVLCDACPDINVLELYFPESHYSFTQTSESYGNWEAGEGHTVYGHPETSTWGVEVDRVFLDHYQIVRVVADISLKWGASSTVTRPHWLYAGGDFGYTEKYTNVSGNYGGTYERQITILPENATKVIRIGARAGSTGGGSYCKIRRLTLYFDGPIPDEFL
jgi:hypothetical protein